MNYTAIIKKLTIFALFLFISVSASLAQTIKFSEPRQEKLLNGLKLLVWNDPKAEKVSVKLRIHSGSAFDPQGKEGLMATLADALFAPDAKDFFAEDLGGSLDVTSNFDYLQINATGNTDQFLTIMETLATAVNNPPINKENTAKIIAARLEKVKELEKNPSYIADRAAAKRLFGNFPYGRAQSGTSESLAKIDFADLLFARQKFLTADNATLTVVGNVKPETAYGIARRYFGAWEKADKKVPATFRQPEIPDTKQLAIENPNVEDNYTLYRSAMMATARNDKDFYATKILTEVWRDKFCLSDESRRGKSLYQPHLLSGVYTVGIYKKNSDELPISSGPCQLILTNPKDGKTDYPPISQIEFEKAKSGIVNELNQQTASINDLADLWLDADTYKLVSVKDEWQKANNVTLQDVQRVAENLQKQPMVSLIVRKSGVAQK